MNRILAATALALLACNMALTLWNGQRTPSIAYVRSQELVYGYLGMKEAMAEFQGRQNMMKANLDTLSLDLQRSIEHARLEKGLELGAASDRELALRKQQQDIAQYQETMSSKLALEEKELLAPVLAQVNSYVEEYARRQGYDMVLGTTASGNVLYGEGAMDITEELLVELNKDYKGE